MDTKARRKAKEVNLEKDLQRFHALIDKIRAGGYKIIEYPATNRVLVININWLPPDIKKELYIYDDNLTVSMARGACYIIDTLHRCATLLGTQENHTDVMG